MKKYLCVGFIFLVCLMLVACGTQNNTPISTESNVNIENKVSSSVTEKEKPEDIAEKALRYVFEKEDVNKAMKLHHSSEYIQGFFSDMYTDVLEDITSARHQAGGLEYKPGYVFVSCEFLENKTISSGELFNDLNEAIVYYGGNSFKSMTECSFEVTYKIIDEVYSESIPVYVTEEDGELCVLWIMCG